MNFRQFLEAGEAPSAGYERLWAKHFSALEPKRQKLFSGWFPAGQDRISIPVNVPKRELPSHKVTEHDRTKRQIQNLFRKTGIFTVTDWKMGLATDNRRNTFKIAKALAAIPGAESLRDDYMGLWFRLETNNKMMIVISQNAHDIAKLSTGRRWQNCNTLEIGDYGQETSTGAITAGLAKEIEKNPEKARMAYVISKKHGITSYQHRVNRVTWDKDSDSVRLELSNGNIIPLTDVDSFSYGRLGKGYTYDKLHDEIVGGGIIAYLVDREDREVKDPYARLMIKRYENPIRGNSVLICTERSGQGIGMEFLARFMTNWLKKRQKSIPFGKYERQGGSWISGDEYSVAMPIEKVTKRNEREILDHVKKLLKQGDNTAYELIKQAVNQIQEKGLNSVSRKFWEEIKKLTLRGEYTPETIVKTIGKIWQVNPQAISFREILGMMSSDVRVVLDPDEKRYSTFDRAEAASKADEFSDFVQDNMTKLVANSSANGNLLLGLMKHLNSFRVAKSDPDLFKRIISKATKLMSSKKVSPEDKTEILSKILDNVRYGWTFRVPDELQEQWLIFAGRLVEKAIPYIHEGKVQYELKWLLEQMREKGLRLPNISVSG